MSTQTKRKKYIISGVVALAAIIVMSVYFIPAQTVMTNIPITPEEQKRNEALGVAQRYIVTSPTFAFDGNINTLDTLSIDSDESLPTQYMFMFAFDSANDGYGDREGQILTPTITPHKMEIIVSEGNVVYAVTDEAWDELKSQFISRPSKLPSTDDVSSFDGKVIDYSTFVNALEHRGVLVEKTDVLDDSTFSVPTIVLSVGGAEIQVYEFDSESIAQTTSTIVSSDGTEIGTSIIRWIDTPHFYMQGKIIVQYIGHNPEMLNLLDSLLGNQFAGM